MTDKQNYFTYTDNTSDSNDKTMENLHKQIIIDGVDVSGCVKLRPYSECGCQPNYGGGYGLCSEWSNCYYKRWQRAETQLVKDEEIQVDMRLKIDELNGLLKSKEQQCEAIKAEKAEILFRTGEIETLQGYTVEDIRRIEQELKEAMDCYVQLDLQRIKENKDLIDKYNNKEQELEQYKQTLDEIKEIAEEYRISNSYYTPLANQILNKISECEVNNG